MLMEKWHKERWPLSWGWQHLHARLFGDFPGPLVFQLAVFITDDSTQALQGQLCPFPGCNPFSTCHPHPGPNPTGLLVDVYCMEWQMTFAVIVSLVPQHRTTPFHRPINLGRRQPLEFWVTSTRETERRITKLSTKQSIMSCNCNKEQWLSRPQPKHRHRRAPGRAPQRAGLALGPTGKIQIGLRIFSLIDFGLNLLHVTPLFCFICNIRI